MTIEEIVLLINACKNAGVSKLKFEKLEVSFHNPSDIPVVVNAMTDPSHTIRRAVEQELEDDQDLRDLALQTLMIEDPLAYEYARKSGNGSFGERP